MGLLYKRGIKVDVAGLSVTDLRIHFTLERQADPTQDKGSVDIYNLGNSEARQIEDRGREIIIQAGYDGVLDLVFQGSVQRVIRTREKQAFITRIELGDQVFSKSILAGIWQGSYAGAQNTRSIARTIITEGMGLTPGPLMAIPAGHTTTDFQAVGSNAAANLIDLLRPIGVTFYEEDGTIRVKDNREAQADSSRIFVSPSTGLIDRPVVTDEGAEVRVFFNPKIRLGGQVELESEELSGLWKVDGLRHFMDNWESKGSETFCDLRRIGGPSDTSDIGL